MPDVVRSWLGRGRTYDDDVRDLAAGVPLRVTASEAGSARGGTLVLRCDAGSVWQPARGVAVPLGTAEVHVEERAGLYAVVVVAALRLRVPAADVDLIRLALAPSA
jgi:hypothetical protein